MALTDVAVAGIAAELRVAPVRPARDASPAGPLHDVLDPTLSRLRAVILLCGSLRGTTLHDAAERSVLDLPVGAGRSVLDCWRDQCEGLARHLGRSALPIRLLVGGMARPPRGTWTDGLSCLSVERDPRDYRGTGGLLCDLAGDYGGGDYLLVANAAQVLRTPLSVLAAALSCQQPDASLVSHADGTPGGLMLLRCGCLTDLPRTGFFDMKEQGLPLLSRRHTVRVVERGQRTGLPLRTLSDYIEALASLHGDKSGAPPEEGAPLFSVAEQGARVHPHAWVHNSVVLCGGRVEEGAVVVGSVVCPGATVRRGVVVADELVMRRGVGERPGRKPWA